MKKINERILNAIDEAKGQMDDLFDQIRDRNESYLFPFFFDENIISKISGNVNMV